jgi:hypothetical protein
MPPEYRNGPSAAEWQAENTSQLNRRGPARPSRNQRSVDSLVREALAWGRKHADKAVRAPEKSSQDATIWGLGTAKRGKKRKDATSASGGCCAVLPQEFARPATRLRESSTRFIRDDARNQRLRIPQLANRFSTLRPTGWFDCLGSSIEKDLALSSQRALGLGGLIRFITRCRGLMNNTG